MSCPEPYVWRDMPDGTRTCDHCGSLHPDDFVDICYHYLEEGTGYEIDMTSKDYKVYASRPGTGNAGQGGIKFYGWHIEDGMQDEVNGAYRLAAVVFRRRYKEKYG